MGFLPSREEACRITRVILISCENEPAMEGVANAIDKAAMRVESLAHAMKQGFDDV